MKKNYITLILSLFLTGSLFAAKFTVTPTGNFTYSPMITNASVGDTIQFIASSFHPVVQVSMATYNSNGNMALSGGFGPSSSNINLVLTNVGTIYFVCNNHSGSGMKGQIVVTASSVNQVSNNVVDVKFLSNPAVNGHISVLNTLEKKGVVYIFNMLGKLQHTEKLNGEANQIVDVELPSGNYLCKFILEGNWTRTEKLIISE